eukprot:COSAG06_NODE_32509_length_504_cov_28.177778_1_plen_85_part_10
MLLRQVGGLKRSAPDADASIGGVTGAETAHLPLTEPAAAAAAAAVGVHGATVWPDPEARLTEVERQQPAGVIPQEVLLRLTNQPP